MLKFDDEYKRKEDLLVEYMDYQYMIDKVGHEQFEPDFCRKVRQNIIDTYRDLRQLGGNKYEGF